MENIIEELFTEGFDWDRTYNQSPAGIMLLDTDYVVIKTNRTMAQMAGFTEPNDIVGKKCYEVLRDESAPPANCINPHYVDSGHIEQLEIHRNGKVILVLETPLFSKTGKIVGHTHTCHDITEQKNKEKEILEAKEKFEAIFTKLPMGIIITDLLSRRILDANAYFCQMIGYSKTELLALTTTDISHPDDCNISIYKTAQASKDKKDYTITKRYVTKFGQVKWVYLTVVLILDDKDSITCAFSLVEDITDKVNSR